MRPLAKEITRAEKNYANAKAEANEKAKQAEASAKQAEALAKLDGYD